MLSIMIILTFSPKTLDKLTSKAILPFYDTLNTKNLSSIPCRLNVNDTFSYIQEYLVKLEE